MSDYPKLGDEGYTDQVEATAQRIKEGMMDTGTDSITSGLTSAQKADIDGRFNLSTSEYHKLKDDSRYRMPLPGEIWIHHSGKAVRIVIVTNRASSPLERDKYPVTVCYRDAGGFDWSRPLWHFRKSYRYSSL